MSNEFPREPVPAEHANRSAASITLILISSIMSVPMIILGGTIGRDYGLFNALIVTIAGCALTAGLAMLMAYAGVRTRRSTALLSEQAFGSRGARVLTAALGIALLGWLAVEMGFIGELAVGGIRRALGAEPPLAIGILGAAAIIGAIAIFGFSVIARVPLIFVPLLLLLLIFVALKALPRLETVDTVAGTAVPIGRGISAIIGSFVIGCIILPDYSRFIGRSRDAMAAAGMALGPVWAAVIGCYAAAGLVARSGDPAEVLMLLGMPAVLTILLPLGLMQNGIMTLYSSALVTSTWLKRIRFTHIVIVTAGIGALIALAGAQNAFVSYLVLLGLVFPPAAAILIQQALFGRAEEGDVRWRNLAIWGVASAVATVCEYKAGITGISALDGFITAFGLAAASSKLGKIRAAPSAETGRVEI
ncbi:cytosine permease [Sphingomonas colocasiae]|uniref:Cytosine permease n=1 Tax=Sphingomonas colocasiae TaxID=1848973 RepID=A0ABS7Q1F7_9SPHN|nr:cytosine permease [Sphingomonas colocasiae]MBY8826367.1 cytosine permease [Sphingomonas colocasiae]